MYIYIISMSLSTCHTPSGKTTQKKIPVRHTSSLARNLSFAHALWRNCSKETYIHENMKRDLHP